jgi:hypothetical protein
MDLQLTATVRQGERRINLLAGRATDMRPAFSRITGELLAAETRLFNTGRGLRDIKTSTVQRKNRDPDARVRHNSYRTLVARGFLRDWLTSSRDQPLENTRSTMLFGLPEGRTTLYYGRLQAKKGRNPVVPRRTVSRVARPIIRDHLLRP